MDKLIITDNPQQTTGIELFQIYVAMTKEQLLKIAKKLDLWVSPNYTKQKTAERLSDEVLENPMEVVTRLAKAELQLLDEIVQAGPDKGVTRKSRKSYYMLQKLGLVVTYDDVPAGTWTMFMPDDVRKSLAPLYKPFLDMALQGVKRPSAKDIRFMGFMNNLFGSQE